MMRWFRAWRQRRRIEAEARKVISEIRIRRWAYDLEDQIGDGALFSEALTNLSYDVKAEALRSDQPAQVYEDFTALLLTLKSHTRHPK